MNQATSSDVQLFSPWIFLGISVRLGNVVALHSYQIKDSLLSSILWCKPTIWKRLRLFKISSGNICIFCYFALTRNGESVLLLNVPSSFPLDNSSLHDDYYSSFSHFHNADVYIQLKIFIIERWLVELFEEYFHWTSCFLTYSWLLDIALLPPYLLANKKPENFSWPPILCQIPILTF